MQESDSITRQATLGSHLALHTLKNKPVDPVFEFLILATKLINSRSRIITRCTKLLQLGKITFSTRLPFTGLRLPISPRRPIFAVTLRLTVNLFAIILHCDVNNIISLSGNLFTAVNILFFNVLIGHSLTLHSLRKTTQHC
ncbi:hypothetical protein [Propionibacterium phage PacnesP2]|uniref:Uncharacterized protein n=1 Tax=Propionibacterium phage PacnesP2 TaxID=1983621 RepID=A0A220NT32_9CAUD|nr:hypothetical protein [Propionibacterium phage PacnesP2]